MGVFFGVASISNVFGVLEIPDIFWGRRVDAGPDPTYEEKMRVTPPPPRLEALMLVWVVICIF